MKIDHIGYAVKNMDNARKQLESLGWIFGKILDDYDRNISICFGEMDGVKIELISPLDSPSPVDLLLKKIGPTIYHICYTSSDFNGDITKLEEKRFRIIVPPAEAIAFEGRKVVFMHSLTVGLIEIVEE